MPIEKEGRFFYGWVIVIVSFLAEFVYGVGTSYVFGIFFKPMSTEFGWTRAATAAGLSISRICGGLVGPIIGPLVDMKHGARLLLVIGALVAGAGFMAFSRIQNLWQFYLIFGIIGAFGLAEIGGIISSTVVAKWFIRKRGRAVGLTISGVTIGAATLAPLSERLISSFGWRSTWKILGLLVWVILIAPAALFMRRRPEDMGLRPDGEEVELKKGSKTPLSTSGAISSAFEEEQVWTWKQALKTPTLWLIVAAFTVSGISLSAIPMHQAAYMTDLGFSGAIAATSVSILAVSSALGKLSWGFVAERLHVRYCVMVCFIGAAISIGILMGARSVPSLFFSSMMYGLTMGGVAVLTALVYANYFGRTSLGAIRGIVQPFSLISMASGPVFAGYVHDVTGSYQFSFAMFIIGWLLGAILIFFARPPEAPEVRDRPAY